MADREVAILFVDYLRLIDFASKHTYTAMLESFMVAFLNKQLNYFDGVILINYASSASTCFSSAFLAALAAGVQVNTYYLPTWNGVDAATSALWKSLLALVGPELSSMYAELLIGGFGYMDSYIVDSAATRPYYHPMQLAQSLAIKFPDTFQIANTKSSLEYFNKVRFPETSEWDLT